MCDKDFELFLSSIDDIIKSLYDISADIEIYTQGLDSSKCSSSLYWIASCYENIRNDLADAYESDMKVKMGLKGK